MLIRKSQVINIIILFMISMSCSNTSRLEQALDFAGSNRSELEIVLAHYKNDINPLKLRAAEFLIENMPYYYYQKDKMIDSLKTIKFQNKDQRTRVQDDIVDKWKHVSYTSVPKVYDAHIITAELLIKNIDFSFRVWESSKWNKHYSFEEFCEYILPYRIKDEPLEDWRELYYNKYKSILDSLYNESDVVEAARAIANYLKNEEFHNQKDWELPHLGASYLFKHRLGTCREACDITLYVMRSLGIPVAVDEYITSPSYSGKHFWTSIIDTTKKAVPFIYNEKELSRAEFDNRDKGKLYRTYFGVQPEKVKGTYTDSNVPTLFRNPFYKDVSSDYFSNKFNIEISNDKGHKYVYLSVFRIDGWQPIDIAKVGKKEATFFNVENSLIYQPIFFSSKGIEEAGYPFTLINSKPIYFKPDHNTLSDIVLSRKYPITSTLKNYLASAIGVKIEGALRKDLQDAKLIYYVTDTLKTNYNIISLTENSCYQYLVYNAPEVKKIQLAEFHCYGNDNEYKAYITGIPQLKGIHKKIIDLIVDRDYISYYMSATEGEKLIFDFGSPIPIKQILFIPRNDDNYIHVGDNYELFYHGGVDGWISLGKQRAEGIELRYKNVPNNTLLWLHNWTRGQEEQVFYYQKGKQVFAYDL